MIPLAGSAYTYAYATLGELFAWIIGWDLTLEYAMGASTVSSGWSNHFIELLNIFHIKMPLWLAYDHWTGLRAAENIVARQMAQASDSSLVPGTQAFLNRVTDIIAAQSPELLQRAHDLLNAPKMFGVEVGCNMPAFIIALVITAILAIGIKESARFNATIVVIKVAVVLFVIGLGFRYVNTSNWGGDWHSFAPYGTLRHRRRRRLYLSSRTSDLTRFPPLRRKPRTRSGICRIGIIASLLICTALYIARGRPCSPEWCRGAEVNIEAPIARAFMDRGLTSASHIITLGALAGLTSVMLVMLLGQTRVLYSMANDGLLPKKFFADIHPKLRTPWKNTILVGLLAAVVGSVTPIDDIGKMVNIGTLAGLRDRVHRGDPAAPHRSKPTATLPYALGSAGADSRHHLQRLYDVQAGLDQLGTADHLAGDRVGGVLHLRPKAQQSAGAEFREKLVVGLCSLVVDGQDSVRA